MYESVAKLPRGEVTMWRSYWKLYVAFNSLAVAGLLEEYWFLSGTFELIIC